MRRHSFSKALAFAAAAVSLSLPSIALAQQPQQTFTGRQIFEGAFLGTGALVAARPALRRFVVAGSREFATSTTAVRALENEIQRVDGSYFREIGPQLTSGDPGIVQNVIARTAADLGKVNATAPRSRHANVAISTPTTPIGDYFVVIVMQTIDMQMYDIAFIVLGGSRAPTGYQGERAVATLTSQLATVAAAS